MARAGAGSALLAALGINQARSDQLPLISSTQSVRPNQFELISASPISSR